MGSERERKGMYKNRRNKKHNKRLQSIKIMMADMYYAGHYAQFMDFLI